MTTIQLVQSTINVPLADIIDFVNGKIKAGTKIPHGSQITATISVESDGVNLVLTFTHKLGDL